MKYLVKILNRLLKLFDLKIISENNFNNDPDYIVLIKSIIGSQNLTIFDIGAHHGESLEIFTKYFNSPRIFSFEPFKESFEILSLKKSKLSNTKIFNLGFSNINGSETFYSYKDSKNPNITAVNSTLELNDENFIPTYSDVQKVECEFMKLDTFIEENNIKYIDLLKIDVQGAEFKVIEGANNSLKDNKIGCVLIEIAIADYYKNQKNFDFYITLFKNYEYELRGFYNLMSDKNKNVLYLDAVFSTRKK
tara:strand:+ start:1910 stop:2656 length:747 start_codon:yes stop_codon:yes gene_type:complete